MIYNLSLVLEFQCLSFAVVVYRAIEFVGCFVTGRRMKFLLYFLMTFLLLMM